LTYLTLRPLAHPHLFSSWSLLRRFVRSGALSVKFPSLNPREHNVQAFGASSSDLRRFCLLPDAGMGGSPQYNVGHQESSGYLLAASRCDRRSSGLTSPRLNKCVPSLFESLTVSVHTNRSPLGVCPPLFPFSFSLD